MALPAIGGLFLPGVRTHGRLVDDSSGGPAYLVACGHTPCDASRFAGRLVDASPRTYLMLSECRHPNDPTRAVTYTSLAGYPDPGIPTVVRVVFGPDGYTPCLPDLCNDFDLTWDGSQYSGYSIPTASGVIPVTITPVFVAGLFAEWHLNLAGDCAPGGATKFIEVAVTCFYPMLAGGAAPLGTISPGCCAGAVDPNSSYFVNVIGCTPARYIGREVGTKNGRKLFMVAECCTPDLCSKGVNCCGCDAVPAAWKFTIAGVGVGDGSCIGNCLAFNGNWTIVYGAAPCGACCWAVPTSESAGACTPGTPWELSCDGTDWVLSTQPLGGGQAVYKAPLGGTGCFGPLEMTLVSTGTGCISFPSSVKLVAA